MKNVVLVSYEQVLENNVLYEWVLNHYGLNEHNVHDEYDDLNIFEGDPEVIRVDGKKAYFVDVTINGTTYVIYLNEIEYIDDVEKLRGTLVAFFQDDYKEKFTSIDVGWGVFDKQPNALAYRGGQGYLYATYSY